MLPRWTRHLWQTWINHTPVVHTDPPGICEALWQTSTCEALWQTSSKHWDKRRANCMQNKITIHFQMSSCKINVSKFRKKVANSELIDNVYSQLQAINPIKMSFGLNFIFAKQSKRSKNNPFHEICSSSLWRFLCVRISAWFYRHLFLARMFVEPQRSGCQNSLIACNKEIKFDKSLAQNDLMTIWLHSPRYNAL